MEYKHIFFLPLLKLLSKMLRHVFIAMLMLHDMLVSKMASMKEKAQCVWWYHQTKSPITDQTFSVQQKQHVLKCTDVLQKKLLELHLKKIYVCIPRTVVFL